MDGGDFLALVAPSLAELVDTQAERLDFGPADFDRRAQCAPQILTAEGWKPLPRPKAREA